MRFATFDTNRLGLVRGEEIVDISDIVATKEPAWPPAPMVRAITEFARIQGKIQEALASRPGRPLEEVRLGAPIQFPSKVIAAPTNYRKHIAEMDTPEMRLLGKVEKVHAIDQYGVFLKAPSSIAGPGAVVELPYPDRRTDHEAELAFVIGKTARNVRRSEAMSYVFGYTGLMDITVRGGEDRSTRKSFDTFTPLGPVIVTTDEITDPHSLRLRLWVNDELRQDANTADLIWDIPKLVEYASHVMTLYPGDIFTTGTPEGVGPIGNGDRVTLEVERIGRFAVTVSERRASCA